MKAWYRVAGLCGVVVMCVLCYWCSLDSPAVFDDRTLFETGGVFDAAVRLDFHVTRTLPYFSIGLIHVLSGGDLAWNRYANMGLHAFVAIALFFFVRRALIGSGASARSAEPISLLVALWFALNPVAVYGSGYLIQRSIVMATLFGLVSALLYLRAQQESRNTDLLSAVLLGAMAMLSKEHAVLWPVGVVVLTPLVKAWDRAVMARAAAFLVMSLPCMAWAVLHRATNLVGTSYEYYAADLLSQMSLPDFAQTPLGLWALSIATQALLFWKYLFFWLVPNPDWMSVDLRVDFQSLWSGWTVPLGLTLSLFAFGMFLRGWWRQGASSLFGRLSTAVLYIAALFCVEFSVVRVQEPFVLYRSFLWMPGYALIMAFLLMELDRWVVARGVVYQHSLWVVLVLACLCLFPLAQDRLRSFSSEEALWRDAKAKLPGPDVAGADRIYYNLARDAFMRKNYKMSLDYSNRVIQQNPSAFYGYLARGSSLLALRDADGALAAFADADRHNPPKSFYGYIEFKRCGVYVLREEKEEVLACLRRSAKLGYEMAALHLSVAGKEE